MPAAYVNMAFRKQGCNSIVKIAKHTTEVGFRYAGYFSFMKIDRRM